MHLFFNQFKKYLLAIVLLYLFFPAVALSALFDNEKELTLIKNRIKQGQLSVGDINDLSRYVAEKSLGEKRTEILEELRKYGNVRDDIMRGEIKEILIREKVLPDFVKEIKSLAVKVAGLQECSDTLMKKGQDYLSKANNADPQAKERYLNAAKNCFEMIRELDNIANESKTISGLLDRRMYDNSWKPNQTSFKELAPEEKQYLVTGEKTLRAARELAEDLDSYDVIEKGEKTEEVVKGIRSLHTTLNKESNNAIFDLEEKTGHQVSSDYLNRYEIFRRLKENKGALVGVGPSLQFKDEKGDNHVISIDQLYIKDFWETNTDFDSIARNVNQDEEGSIFSKSRTLFTDLSSSDTQKRNKEGSGAGKDVLKEISGAVHQLQKEVDEDNQKADTIRLEMMSLVNSGQREAAQKKRDEFSSLTNEMSQANKKADEYQRTMLKLGLNDQASSEYVLVNKEVGNISKKSAQMNNTLNNMNYYLAERNQEKPASKVNKVSVESAPESKVAAAQPRTDFILYIDNGIFLFDHVSSKDPDVRKLYAQELASIITSQNINAGKVSLQQRDYALEDLNILIHDDNAQVRSVAQEALERIKFVAAGETGSSLKNKETTGQLLNPNVSRGSHQPALASSSIQDKEQPSMITSAESEPQRAQQGGSISKNDVKESVKGSLSEDVGGVAFDEPIEYVQDKEGFTSQLMEGSTKEENEFPFFKGKKLKAISVQTEASQ